MVASLFVCPAPPHNRHNAGTGNRFAVPASCPRQEAPHVQVASRQFPRMKTRKCRAGPFTPPDKRFPFSRGAAGKLPPNHGPPCRRNRDPSRLRTSWGGVGVVWRGRPPPPSLPPPSPPLACGNGRVYSRRLAAACGPCAEKVFSEKGFTRLGRLSDRSAPAGSGSKP